MTEAAALETDELALDEVPVRALEFIRAVPTPMVVGAADPAWLELPTASTATAATGAERPAPATPSSKCAAPSVAKSATPAAESAAPPECAASSVAKSATPPTECAASASPPSECAASSLERMPSSAAAAERAPESSPPASGTWGGSSLDSHRVATSAKNDGVWVCSSLVAAALAHSGDGK